MQARTALLAIALATTFPLDAIAANTVLQGVSLTSGEAAWNQLHVQVKSDRAHAAGHTGRGATVAVLDTGVQGNHIELKTRLSGARMYDSTIRKWVAPTDADGHGTHVAGIIAGSTGTGYTYGVAPDAKILPVKVFFSDSWTASTTSLATGLKTAAGTRAVSVINLSLGAGGPLGGSFEKALRSAVSADKLIIAAAGNQGGDAPIWPARYAKESWAKGQIIAVGAVDANNRLASFSNRAGDTANWYLVAPGVSVLSSYNNGGYAFMSGTSIAAPAVAGAAALLEGTWPQLKANQVASILLQTATDLGAPGIDETYGRGLLNVERAMQPVGTLTVPISRASKKIRRTKATLRTSVASWSGLHAAALEGQFRGITVDAFNRDFATDFGSGIRAPATERISDALDMAGRTLQFTERRHADATRFVTAVEERRSHDLHAAQQTQRSLIGSSAVFTLAAGREIAFATGDMAGTYFGLADTDHGLANPYLGLTRSSAQLALGFTRDSLSFKAGILDSSLDAAMLRQLDWSKAGGGGAMVVEMNYALGQDAMIGIQYASIEEQDAWLGSVADEVLALGQAATRTITAHASQRVGRNTVLAAQYSVGRTADARGKGLLSTTEDVQSQAFAFGLVSHHALIPNDRLSLTLSSPLRITRGSAAVSMPVAISDTGEATFESRRIALAATSRELKLGLDYATPLSRTSSLSLLLAARYNANHVAGDRAMQAGVVYRTSF